MTLNYDKSAASVWHQVAAWVSDMISNFYVVNNHKIAINSRITKAIENIIADLKTLEFVTFFGVCLTKLKNN